MPVVIELQDQHDLVVVSMADLHLLAHGAARLHQHPKSPLAQAVARAMAVTHDAGAIARTGIAG